MAWDTLADLQTVQKTIIALSRRQINAILVEDGAAAHAKIEELIPQGSEVYNSSSITLDTTGITKFIEENERYVSVKKRVFEISDPKKRLDARRAAVAVKYYIGSVHAITEDGLVVVASKTGSQLPAYAYTAENVIWVAGTQKIVKNLEEAFRRIREYTFPLEMERAKKAYGTGTGINKILIIEKEEIPNRITLVLVNQVLGF